jgi:hypothetical protein
MSGTVKLESRVRKDSTSQWFAAPNIYDSKGNAAFSLAFDAAGQIVFKNATGAWEKLQSYQTRTWYKIDLEINTDSDTYDLYINGIKKLSQEPLVVPITDIAKVKFYTNVLSVANIDSVKVFKVLDTTSPVIVLYEPGRLTGNHYLVEKGKFQVTGKISEPGVVTVNGVLADVKPDLTFEANIDLRPGMNKIIVSADDLEGNAAEPVGYNVVPPSEILFTAERRGSDMPPI